MAQGWPARENSEPTRVSAGSNVRSDRTRSPKRIFKFGREDWGSSSVQQSQAGPESAAKLSHLDVRILLP